VRKKSAVGVGLFLVVLLVTVVWHMPPAGAPLRVGMTWEEADQAMQESGRRFAYGIEPERLSGTPLGHNDGGYTYWAGEFPIDGGFPLSSDNDSHYFSDIDLFGRHHEVVIYMKSDYKTVDRWEVRLLPRTRPPWLDTAMKWVGW